MITQTIKFQLTASEVNILIKMWGQYLDFNTLCESEEKDVDKLVAFGLLQARSYGTADLWYVLTDDGEFLWDHYQEARFEYDHISGDDCIIFDYQHPNFPDCEISLACPLLQR